jgi:protein disulfide-isomerase
MAKDRVAMAKKFNPVWGLFLILVGFIAVVGVTNWLRGDEIVPWRMDLTAAQAESKQSNKPLLMYFTASWCGPCQSLRHTTWADPAVETALRQYVPVKIDIDQHRDVAMDYHVEAVPHFVLLSPEGKPQKLASGAMDSADFLAWLKGK